MSMEQLTLQAAQPEMSLETKVSNAISVFNEKKAELTELAEASRLKVADINDNKQLKAVGDARKRLKATRVKIQNDGKEIRSSIKVLTDSVTAKEKELVGIIAPVEDELEAEEQRVEDERNRIKEEAARIERERVQARVKVLLGYGCAYDGTSYSIAGLHVQDAVLKVLSDEFFAEFVGKVKIEADRIELERLEAERVKAEADEAERQRIAAEQKQLAEERAELARLREENNRREAEMKAEQERMRRDQEAAEARIREEQEKIDAEKRRIEAEAQRVKAEADNKRWRSRLSELKEVGWNGQYAFSRLDSGDAELITYDQLINLSDEDFAIKRDYLNESTEKKIAEIEAEAKRIADEHEAKRLQDIEAAKQQWIKDEADRVIAENERKEREEADRIAEEKRLAALAPDKVKLLALSDAIGAIPKPELTSDAAKALLITINDNLTKIQMAISKNVKSL